MKRRNRTRGAAQGDEKKKPTDDDPDSIARLKGFTRKILRVKPEEIKKRDKRAR